MIFTPFIFNEKEFKNRLIMTAINTGFSFDEKSFVKIEEFYKERAKGGASAITTICAVEKYGAFNNMPFNCESYNLLCNKISNTLKEYDCKHIVQLFHYGSGNGEREEFIPHNISNEKIQYIIESFIKTAKVCIENGADAIEIDFSKGHIFSDFISYDINKREDSYGINFENRIKFPIKVIEGIRNNIHKNIPIIINISLEDILNENIEN